MLNEYETSPYFLQIFQINAAFCLIIYMFCKCCEPLIVLKKSKQKTTQKSKQKQFHVCKSYRTPNSTLPCIGNSEENINLYCIHLAVTAVGLFWLVLCVFTGKCWCFLAKFWLLVVTNVKITRQSFEITYV